MILKQFRNILFRTFDTSSLTNKRNFNKNEIEKISEAEDPAEKSKVINLM